MERADRFDMRWRIQLQCPVNAIEQVTAHVTERPRAVVPEATPVEWQVIGS